MCERVGLTPSRKVYVERLRAFYAERNPEHLHGRPPAQATLELEETLAKWEGREERLFHVLRQMHDDDSAASDKTEL